MKCDKCGHENPHGRLICESCGGPMAGPTVQESDMRTQAIPSLDDLLMKDRRDHQALEGLQGGTPPWQNDEIDEEAPTEAVDFGALLAEHPDLAGTPKGPASAPNPSPAASAPRSEPPRASAPSPATSAMDDDDEPPKKSSKAMIFVGIAMLLLFLACCLFGSLGGGYYYWMARAGSLPTSSADSAAPADEDDKDKKDDEDSDESPENPAGDNPEADDEPADDTEPVND